MNSRNIWQWADSMEKPAPHEHQATSWNVQDICVLERRLKCFIIKTGQSEPWVLNTVLIKNGFLAFNVNIQYASQMDFLFQPFPNQKVSETNKASENGTEAKMYVNNRVFWYKQTRKEEQPFCHLFLLAHCVSRSHNLPLAQTRFSSVSMCNRHVLLGNNLHVQP